MKKNGGKVAKNGISVENLVEKVQNSNKITMIFNFSTHLGCGKVEKSPQFYSIVENGRCRKIKIFTFSLDKKMLKKGVNIHSRYAYF